MLVINLDYFEFVKLHLAEKLDGLYFIHLNDGCRTSLAKLIYIKNKFPDDWTVIDFDPQIKGHNISFIKEYFVDMPSMHLVKSGTIIKSLDGVSWPYEIKELVEEYKDGAEKEKA